MFLCFFLRKTCTVSVFDKASRVWDAETLPTERDTMFRGEDRVFLEAITEDKDVALGLDEAVKSMRIVQEAMKQNDLL